MSHDADLARMVAACGHELRTPVASIRTFLDALVDRWDRLDEGSRAELVDQMHADLDRMTRMVDDLTDAGRLEAAALTLDRVTLDLGDLVADIVDRFVSMSATPPVVLEVRTSVSIDADPGRVEQILVNLLDNVARHAPGATAGVLVDREGADALVIVSDDGPGIPTDRTEDAFRAFASGLGRTRGRAGLGLWISRALADAHGGGLELVDKSPAGSSVRLTLPVQSASTTPAPDPAR